METWLKKIIVFLTSQTITLIGSLVVGYAVIWYITLETSSGKMMAIAVACNYLPLIFASLFAGVWADRYNRKLLIIAADAFTALTTLLLLFLWISGNTNWIFIFIVIALRSIGSGIQQPAVNALIPQIVPVEHLTRVNAINSTIMNILTLLAPALGGVLLARGFVHAMAFDVITAILGIGVLIFLKVGKVEKTEGAVTGSMRGELKEGLSYAMHTDWLRFLLIFYAVGFFFIAPASTLSPILVERVFPAEVWLPGWDSVYMLTFNEMAWSIGAILGGIIIAIWGGFKNRMLSLAVSMLIFGITFAGMGLVNNFWLYLAIMAASGLFLPMYSTAEMTFIQEKTDPQMMGRVFAIINIIVSASVPLAMVIFGPLADIIDVRLIMIGSGLAMAILSLYVLSNKRIMAFDKDGRPDLKKKVKSEDVAQINEQAEQSTQETDNQ